MQRASARAADGQEAARLRTQMGAHVRPIGANTGDALWEWRVCDSHPLVYGVNE